MYTLSEHEVDFILSDIKTRGVEMEDLQLNLLDHICCIIESELQPGDNFDQFYQQVIPRFFKKELKEIEEETILLLTFKNYYAMKKAMIRTGIVSVTALILGSVFKIMYWPGAGPLLLLGIGSLSLLFLPLLFILKTRDSTNKRDKLISGISLIIGFFLCLATLFSVMHWPLAGSGVFWLTAISISTFILIPVYFITGIRNPDTKINTIVTTIVLVGATGLLFTMINIRPPRAQAEIKMYAYIQSEELLKKMQRTNAPGNNQLAEDINSTAEQIKTLILENTTGQLTISKDFESKNMRVEEGNLGSEFREGEKGVMLFSHLKEMVNKFNATVNNEEDKIPVDHFQVDKIGFYSNFVVLDYLVQIQMYAATAGNKVTACK
jgi:hypothetical protein